MRRWYAGVVTQVLAGGSKIRIRYNDGDSEISTYPDKDIVLDEEILTPWKDGPKQKEAAATRSSRNSKLGPASRNGSCPNNDTSSGKEKAIKAPTSRRSRNSELGPTSRRRAHPNPVASSGKDKRTKADTSRRSRNSELVSTSSRRRSRPKFYVATPWNDQPSEETEEKKDSVPKQLSVKELRKKIVVGRRVKVRYYIGPSASQGTIVQLA